MKKSKEIVDFQTASSVEVICLATAVASFFDNLVEIKFYSPVSLNVLLLVLAVFQILLCLMRVKLPVGKDSCIKKNLKNEK